ncbi:MAG TPA: hypothetical protein VMU10_10980 [Desulfomonilia bacterium]|nr:hypothetical protein [Desulfomonilia bacterium]
MRERQRHKVVTVLFIIMGIAALLAITVRFPGHAGKRAHRAP